MSKHLTLSDRAIIEKYLVLDMPFSYISKQLNRSGTTISREIKKEETAGRFFRLASPSKLYQSPPC